MCMVSNHMLTFSIKKVELERYLFSTLHGVGTIVTPYEKKKSLIS